MTHLTRPELEDFPDSRYARELRGGFPGLRFSSAVEAEYVASHLRRVGFCVRSWYLVGAVFTAVCLTLELARFGPMSAGFACQSAFFMLMLAMTWLVFSPWFERHYLRAATVLVPLICCGIVAFADRELANGHQEQLILIPGVLASTFFLAGVMFRTAAAAGGLTIATFLLGGIYFGIPTRSLLECVGMLASTGVLCSVAAWDVEKSYRESFLEARIISELTACDGLTGIKSRRAFDDHLAQVWHTGPGLRKPLAILFIDCDHFKRYNSACGNEAGDQALRRIARLVDGFARAPLDIAARYGGAEFALILHDVTGEQATHVAEQLRAAVQGAGIKHDRMFAQDVITVSIGVAVVRPTSSLTPAEAVQLADEALYTAKRSGRNYVSVLQRVPQPVAIRNFFDEPSASTQV